MNTSSLTVGVAQQSRATVLSAQARRLDERLAVRTGLALLAWSRRRDERRTPDAVRLRRETELLATQLRDDAQRRVAFTAPLA